MTSRERSAANIQASIIEQLNHIAVLVHPERENGVDVVLWKHRVIPEGIAVGVMWVRVHLPILAEVDDWVVIGSTREPVEGVEGGDPPLLRLSESDAGNRDAHLGWSFLPRQWVREDESGVAVIRRCMDVAPPTFDADRFKHRVKELMVQQALSKADLAHRLNEHPSYVTRFLARNAEPRFHAAERFAIALRVDPQELIVVADGSGRPSQPR